MLLQADQLHNNMTHLQYFATETTWNALLNLYVLTRNWTPLLQTAQT